MPVKCVQLQNGWTHGINGIQDPQGKNYRPADLLSVSQVKELRGCSRQNVHALIASGVIESMRIGKGFAVPVASAVKFVKRGRRSS